MPKLLRIAITGMFISFLGSLPLGTLNVAIMQISVTEGLQNAFLFGLGCLISEVVYVRLSLVAMDWVRKQTMLFKVLEWMTLGIVVMLAISSFYTATHPTETKNVILNADVPPLLLGLIMSALNPVQIPFWFGWSTVLFTKKVLEPRSSHYNAYIGGIGFGTMLGNCVFVFGGQLAANAIAHNKNILNWVIGGIFTLTALIQVYKMSRKKDVEHRLEDAESETGGHGGKVEDFLDGHDDQSGKPSAH